MSTAPEFDQYSPGYDAGMDDPLKRAFGPDARAFLAPKLDLLVADVRRRIARPAGEIRHLDFGCGSAEFLQLVTERGLGWQAEGCDISGGMIAEAGRRWPALTANHRLWQIQPGKFPESQYDVI